MVFGDQGDVRPRSPDRCEFEDRIEAVQDTPDICSKELLDCGEVGFVAVAVRFDYGPGPASRSVAIASRLANSSDATCVALRLP